MKRFRKGYNLKIVYLVILISFLFSANLYSLPNNTLRVQSSFQNADSKNKIYEIFLRETLKKTPIKEIAVSAQFTVLTNEDLGIVVRIEKTREETEAVFRQWGFHTWMSSEDFRGLIDRVHAGKKEGLRIFKEKLLFSKAIWGIMELSNVEILEQTKDDNIPRREKKINIQKKGDMVLWQAISEHYKKGERDKIKQILNALLKNVQEEIWGYGVHDKTLSFSVNWGVDYLEEGVDVRLFDFWEATDNKQEAIVRLKKQIEQLNRNETWEIMDKNHDKSIISLTDQEIATWFLGRIKEELTLEKLEYWWGRKLKELDTLDSSMQLLGIQKTIFENL